MRFEDPDTHRRKANWHARRAGTGAKNASITKVGQHEYRAELEENAVGHYHPDHYDHDFAFR